MQSHFEIKPEIYKELKLIFYVKTEIMFRMLLLLFSIMSVKAVPIETVKDLISNTNEEAQAETYVETKEGTEKWKDHTSIFINALWFIPAGQGH